MSPEPPPDFNNGRDNSSVLRGRPLPSDRIPSYLRELILGFLIEGADAGVVADRMETSRSWGSRKMTGSPLDRLTSADGLGALAR